MGGELLAFSGSINTNTSITEPNNDRLITVSSRCENVIHCGTHVEEAFHEGPESSIPPVLFNRTIVGVIQKKSEFVLGKL